MDYFSLLHLQKEPFSNSPDPEMFFQSVQHQGGLQKLEMAIRLKRGLSVVVGDIGTGKSTLCRQLIRVITRDNTQIVPYLILDPEFTTPLEFLLTVSKTFALDCQGAQQSEWQLKDIIKKHLLSQAIENQKILVLIIDEGQKLPGFCVELLREFLNFETNQHKLLQIVIFAQEEFTVTLQQKPNFADRITTYQHLRPLSFHETRAMIDFRLDKAHTEPGPPPKLFSLPAVVAIFFLTRGYPRRIVMLCSKVIIAILVNRDQRAGFFHVLQAAKETSLPRQGRAIQWRRVIGATAVIAASAVAIAFSTQRAATTIRQRPIPQPAATEKEMTIETPAAVGGLVAGTNAASPQSSPTRVASLPPIPQPKSSLGQIGTLGTLTIEDDVTLSKMIARVYGRYSPKKLALVLEANPQISDPDHLVTHAAIHFPALPESEYLSGQRDLVYLELAQTTTLGEAYAMIKNSPEGAPSLRIIPERTADNKVIFHVIMEQAFADRQSALAKADSLPQQWRSMAKARHGNEFNP